MLWNEIISLRLRANGDLDMYACLKVTIKYNKYKQSVHLARKTYWVDFVQPLYYKPKYYYKPKMCCIISTTSYLGHFPKSNLILA